MSLEGIDEKAADEENSPAKLDSQPDEPNGGDEAELRNNINKVKSHDDSNDEKQAVTDGQQENTATPRKGDEDTLSKEINPAESTPDRKIQQHVRKIKKLKRESSRDLSSNLDKLVTIKVKM